MIPEIKNLISLINSKEVKLREDDLLLKFFVGALTLQRISVTWYWNWNSTWKPYTDDDQKTITDAFTDGKKSATLTIREGNYNISFYNKEGYFSPVQIRKVGGKNLIRKVDYSLSLVPIPDFGTVLVPSNIYDPGPFVAPASEHASVRAQIMAPAPAPASEHASAPAPSSEHASARAQTSALPSYEEVMDNPGRYPVTKSPLMTLV